jgi:hypothetical protein
MMTMTEIKNPIHVKLLSRLRNILKLPSDVRTVVRKQEEEQDIYSEVENVIKAKEDLDRRLPEVDPVDQKEFAELSKQLETAIANMLDDDANVRNLAWVEVDAILKDMEKLHWDEIAKLKKEIQALNTKLEYMRRENAELRARVTTFENAFDEKLMSHPTFALMFESIADVEIVHLRANIFDVEEYVCQQVKGCSVSKEVSISVFHDQFVNGKLEPYTVYEGLVKRMFPDKSSFDASMELQMVVSILKARGGGIAHVHEEKSVMLSKLDRRVRLTYNTLHIEKETLESIISVLE